MWISPESTQPVTLAQAGVQESSQNLDSDLRRNDEGAMDYGLLNTL